MKIERYLPPPPKRQFTMIFNQDESWAIIAALREYAEHHPQASCREEWLRWASELDKQVRA